MSDPATERSSHEDLRYFSHKELMSVLRLIGPVEHVPLATRFPKAEQFKRPVHRALKESRDTDICYLDPRKPI